MGINFQSGHPCDVYEAEYGARIGSLLQNELGHGVPLGIPGKLFCLDDQLGWSWWNEMRRLASDKLPENDIEQISAVDAWQGVYLDKNIDRVLLWPDGNPDRKDMNKSVGFAIDVVQQSWFLQKLIKLGIRKAPSVPPVSTTEAAMEEMTARCGARPGEGKALQVGNLRKLKSELDALLQSIGTDSNATAVTKLMQSYAEDDDRVDDDPEIQCLCHAWLTATHAIENKAPLWLVK